MFLISIYTYHIVFYYYFSSYVARRNLAFHLTRIRELILEAMQSITAKHWSDCIDHVKGIEMNYWASDIARDEMPEPVIINLDSDDDDSATDTASENEDEI